MAKSQGESPAAAGTAGPDPLPTLTLAGEPGPNLSPLSAFYNAKKKKINKTQHKLVNEREKWNGRGIKK